VYKMKERQLAQAIYEACEDMDFRNYEA
jgi:hypothetical protein